MRNLFITGGAGFLGRAIIHHFQEREPDIGITIYSRDEEKQARVRAKYPQVRCILGDVTDLQGLTVAMAGHDAVIHAAALKYIPECERAPQEAIRVNVQGSINVIHAAVANRVERIVGISTDKVCEPINVYGMTKALMERAFLKANHDWSDTQFNLVRYGNVVGSTGSVIRSFMAQAEARQMFITDPKMTRFWLSASGAVELITRAFSEPVPSILVPLLPSMTLESLAAAIWVDVLGADALDMMAHTEITGNRGGEKLHETLMTGEEARRSVCCGGLGEAIPLYRLVRDRTENSLWTGAYTSDDTDDTVTPAQMIAMIREAQQWSV